MAVVASRPGSSSVETRPALAAEAGDRAIGPHTSGTDNPFTVDGTVLAQQKALVERAAALTARARRIQDLSEQHRRRQLSPGPDDPASVHGLSIVVTPDAGVAPGDGAVLLRAPITPARPVGQSGGRTSNAMGADARHPAPADSGPPAPADVTPHGSGPVGIGPVEARSAFGLDPLDAMTAGLGRARRLRLMQYTLLGVGGAGLLTGIMMTVSSLNG
jgi:hypothetical protein